MFGKVGTYLITLGTREQDLSLSQVGLSFAHIVEYENPVITVFADNCDVPLAR